MLFHRSVSRVVAAGAIASVLAFAAGCGSKEETPKGPPQNSALAPEAQSAMQAQQKADADIRASHASPPPK